ncbi:MAG TPA: outer membrane protein assembly factor BamD, partial [Bacteroidota bacterium]
MSTSTGKIPILQYTRALTIKRFSRFVKTAAAGILFSLSIVFFSACSSEEILQQLPAEERFALAMGLFHEEDYLEAEKEFRVITLQFPGTALADDAQFYLGESRYFHDEFILAAYEYDILLKTMPTSEYASRARYRKAECYYNLSPESYRDQDYSRKAIDEFQAFLGIQLLNPFCRTMSKRV